jgi:hypothetical protein
MGVATRAGASRWRSTLESLDDFCTALLYHLVERSAFPESLKQEGKRTRTALTYHQDRSSLYDIFVYFFLLAGARSLYYRPQQID